MVEALNNECVMGALVRGDTLYAVCARKTQEGYENLVIASKDTQEWWSVASFSNEAYAVSLEEADGRFCVGLGCGYQTKRGVPPPKAAGDILCVTPKPGSLVPPQ